MQYLDLRAQWEPLIPTILSEIEHDMRVGRFVGGPRITRLEKALEGYTGFKYCICVSSGTMAIEAACRHLKNEVEIPVMGIPNLTFQATAFGALRAGLPIKILSSAVPLTAYLQEPSYASPMIPVDLYGTPTNWEAETLYPLLVDGCQSLGAKVNGKKPGETNVWAMAISFYPGKNLGSMGEAGALLTNDDNLEAFARAYINQGQYHKGQHEELGTNGRMHALQAIPIFHGLGHLDEWNAARRVVAAKYDERLGKVRWAFDTLKFPEGRLPNRHIYPLFAQRAAYAKILRQALKDNDIPFGWHYPESLRRSTCFYAEENVTRLSPMDLPVRRAEDPFECEISLPIHPCMTEEEVDAVCDTILDCVERIE